RGQVCRFAGLSAVKGAPQRRTPTPPSATHNKNAWPRYVCARTGFSTRVLIVIMQSTPQTRSEKLQPAMRRPSFWPGLLACSAIGLATRSEEHTSELQSRFDLAF